MFELNNGRVVLQVREDLGAAIAKYEFVDGGAIFRAGPENSHAPFKMACNLLLPWCNRISDGGFTYQDVFYPLEPNVKDEPSALHGDAFLKEWSCISQSDTSLTFELFSSSVKPFDYRAVVTYSLEGDDLIVDLSLTNLSELKLPYGMGLHPWFEQDEDTEIQMQAEQVILSDENTLPVDKVALSKLPYLDFRQSSTVPEKGLDNCYTAWDQQALLTWPSRGMQVRVQADETLSECHIYSKGKQSDFFCFEPVSHPANTHNWPKNVKAELADLKKGESLSASCRFSPTLS